MSFDRDLKAYGGWESVRASFSYAAQITPDDNADLAMPVRALRAETDGTVAVLMPGIDAAVTLNFKAGETRMLYVTRVLEAGTTATGLEGLA